MINLAHVILSIQMAVDSSSSRSRSSDHEFHIAPMQCYTMQPLRKLFHILSPSSMKWTEMEKLDDLYPKNHDCPEDYLNEALQKRLRSSEDYDEESYLTLQIGTNDPDRLGDCVQSALRNYNFREINMNCGCPSIESGGATKFGASLMKDAPLTGRLVESTRKALEQCEKLGNFAEGSRRPDVSVKCRIGTFDHYDDLRPLNEDDYKYLKRYVSTIQDAGGDHVILHSRPAILSGLSPIKNRKGGIVPLDYTFAERIAQDFPELRVTLNGGITSLDKLEEMRDDQNSRISSHMVGRWILRRPLDLLGVETLLHDDDEISRNCNDVNRRRHIYADRAEQAITEYTDHAVHMASARTSSKSRNKKGRGGSGNFTMADLALPLFLIVEQLREMHAFNHEVYDNDGSHYDNDGHFEKDPDENLKAKLLSYEDIDRLHVTIEESVERLTEFAGGGGKNKKKARAPYEGSSGSVNFKRLSSSFKGLVGTKVANKWKRNRSEL